MLVHRLIAVPIKRSILEKLRTDPSMFKRMLLTIFMISWLWEGEELY